MSITRVAVTGLALAAVALVPVSAAARTVQPRTSTPAPRSGTWNMTGDVAGSFTVTAHHKSVAHLKGHITSSAETPCGSGAVKVTGTTTITDTTGEDGSRFWVVGHFDANEDGVLPRHVTVVHGGTSSKGTLELSFLNARGHSKEGNAAGEIIYGGGSCDLQFDIHSS